MKKLFLTVCLTAILSTPSIAACEGGTLSDDGQFCLSNIDLNWWSAANWCKANGMHLPTMYEVCPDWNGNTGEGLCSPIAGFRSGLYGWTATVRESGVVFGVNLASGRVTSNYLNNTYRALCTN